jgi:hypothetical protein
MLLLSVSLPVEHHHEMIPIRRSVLMFLSGESGFNRASHLVCYCPFPFHAEKGVRGH